MEETTLQFPSDLKEILQRANEIEAVNAAIDDLEPDISEVEYPK